MFSFEFYILSFYVSLDNLFPLFQFIKSILHSLEIILDPLSESRSVTPQKYPRIFIIILLYIPGIIEPNLGFLGKVINCEM